MESTTVYYELAMKTLGRFFKSSTNLDPFFCRSPDIQPEITDFVAEQIIFYQAEHRVCIHDILISGTNFSCWPFDGALRCVGEEITLIHRHELHQSWIVLWCISCRAEEEDADVRATLASAPGVLVLPRPCLDRPLQCCVHCRESSSSPCIQ